jgi:hypothetical protein
MLYQSLKFTNNIWVLAELKMEPHNPNVQVKIVFYSCPLYSIENNKELFFVKAGAEDPGNGRDPWCARSL